MRSESTPNPVSSEAAPPFDLRGTSELARQAAQRRDWPDADRLWDIVRSHAPDNPEAYVGGAHARRESGRLAEAEHLLDAATSRFPDHEGIALAFAGLASARRDWPAASTRWEAARRRFPDNPSCYVGSINALKGTQRNEDAEALLPEAARTLEAVQRRGIETASSLQLALLIANAQLDWPASRTAAEAIIASAAPASSQTYLCLAQACWHLGELDAADQAARQAAALNPTLTQAIVISTWVATEKGDGKSAIESYRRLVALQPDTVRWSLKLVELLNWLGRVDEAVAELDRVCRRWSDDPMVISFLRNFGPGSALARDMSGPKSGEAQTHIFQPLLSTAPSETTWKRPLLVPASMQEVQIVEVPGAETLALVFTGAGDGVSMPLSLFDRYLAPLDVTAVYLKDFRRLLYLRGIRSLSDDYDGTLTALQALLARFGAKRLTTIGNCDGAFAAIRYGVELGAERVLAASPATHFTEETLSKLDKGRNFKRAHLATNVALEMTDLKPFLEARAHPTKIEIFFREGEEREERHARRVSHVPGVTLHPLAGSAPAALHRLALSTPNFHTALGDWLGVATAV